MTKKILSLILALAMVLPMVPVFEIPVFAATSGTTGDCTWNLNDVGTLTISGYGAMENYTSSSKSPWGQSIKKVIIEQGVTSIGNYTFSNCTTLTSVTFPASLENIGEGAFDGCQKLSSLDFVQCSHFSEIGKYAFRNCTSLTSFKLPNYNSWPLMYIEEGAFYNCTNLISVDLPNETIHIGNNAFEGCSKLYSFICKDKFYAGDYSFNKCKSLTTLSGRARHVGKSAFASCASLISIEVGYDPDPTSGSYFSSPIGQTAFSGCTALSSITLHSSVNEIGLEAFRNCTSLASIHIPAKVTSLSGSHFSGCISLSSITVDENNTKYYSVGNCIIQKGSANKLVVGCKNSVIPDDGSVTRIAAYAFDNCDTPVSVTVPNSITYIENQAFYGSQLESITLPFVGTSATSLYPLSHIFILPNYDYSTGTGIETYDSSRVPSSLKTVKITNANLYSGAFANCTNITTIGIGGGVLNIDTAAFTGTTGLERIEVDENNPHYSSVNGILYNKEKTQIIWVPDNHKTLFRVNYTYANGDTALPTVEERIKTGAPYAVNVPEIIGYSARSDGDLSGTMPDHDVVINVVYYENERFSYGDCNDSISWTLYTDGMLVLRGVGNMPNYTSGGTPWASYADQVKTVYIDPRITSIGNYSFENCRNMTFIDYGYSMKTIGEYAFSGCSSLASFKLPDSVTTISKGAFSNCTGLNNVVISDYVTSIEDSAFSGCSELIQVTIGGSVSNIGNNAFADCGKLTQVYFRGEPATLGDNALGSTNNKYVYYYSSVKGWDEAITDSRWYSYIAIPYNAIAKEDFKGTNVYIIKVVDKHNTPLTNAVVEYGSAVQSTISGGMAYFVRSTETQKLTVNCSGHNTYEDDAFIANPTQIIDIIELSDKPTTLKGVSCKGQSIATSVVVLNCAENATIPIKVLGNSPKYTITKYELLQGNRLIESAKTSKSSYTFEVNSNAFEEGETVFVRMYTADGNTVTTALNIDVVKLATVNKNQILTELSDVNIGASLGDFGDLNFKLPFSIHGAEEIFVHTEGRSIFVGINMDINDMFSRKLSKKAIQEQVDDYLDSKIDELRDSVNGSEDKSVEVALGGYLEIEYLGNGEYYIKSSYVKLSVGLMMESELNASFYGIIGVYLKIKFGANGSLKLKISRFSPEQGFGVEDFDLGFGGLFDVEGGVFLLWGAGKAGVFGNLSGGFTIGFVPKVEVKSVYITGDLGVRWSIGWGLIKGEKSIGPKDIYRWPSEDVAATYKSRLFAARQDPNSYTENDRAYLENRSSWLSGAQGDGYLQKNVYDNVAPKTVTCGDTTVMVWLDDNAQRDNANFQMLYYSVCNDGVWSEPKAVCDNGTFDCEFDVYTDGEKIYVIYTEMKEQHSAVQTLDITDLESIESFVNGVEVNVIVYENGKFGEPVRLTNNTICEQLPTITETNGVITATWLESNALGLGNEICDYSVAVATLKETKWNKPTTLVTGKNAISDITAISLDGNAYTAFIVDTNGDASTTDDQALVLRSENGDSVQLDNGAIANVEFTEILGTPVLTWYNNGKIYMISNVQQKPVSLTPEGVSAGADYQIVSVSEEQALLFFTMKNSDQKSTDVYGMFINRNGAITSPVQMTKTDGYVTSYSVYSENDDLFVAFTETFAEVFEGGMETVANFRTTELNFSWDIVIENVKYDLSEAQPNSELDIEFNVTNAGTNLVDCLTLSFYDHSGKLLYTTDCNVSLASGASAGCEATIVLPKSLSTEDYIIEILPQNKMAIVEDSEPENNRIELALAYADMSISTEQKIIGEKNYILFTVANEGNTESAAMLKVNAEDRLLSELKTNVIAPGSTEQYLVDIHALTTNADKILSCTVTSDFTDPCALNDKDAVYLLHINDQTLAVDPKDKISNPELSASAAEFDRYAPSDIVWEITAEADHFSAIENLKKGTDYTVSSEGKITISSSYLKGLEKGETVLNLLFDFGEDQPTVRKFTVTVVDTTPTSLGGAVNISGETVVGKTVSADLSDISPRTANLIFEWSIDGETVSTERTYTITANDYGKQLTLTITGTGKYAGTLTAQTEVGLYQPDAPTKPLISSVKDTQFFVVKVEGVEYSLDLETWQDDNLFTGLQPETNYTVYARFKATNSSLASQPSPGALVTTLDHATVGHIYDNACDADCNVCSATRQPEHVYDNDEDRDCNECDFVRPIIGDVDGNEAFDLDDVIYLLYHINFKDAYPVNQSVDFDGSGAVDLDDAIYLMFHINFPEAFPLH